MFAACSPCVRMLLKVETSPPTKARLGNPVGITLRYLARDRVRFRVRISVSVRVRVRRYPATYR